MLIFTVFTFTGKNIEAMSCDIQHEKTVFSKLQTLTDHRWTLLWKSQKRCDPKLLNEGQVWKWDLKPGVS